MCYSTLMRYSGSLVAAGLTLALISLAPVALPAQSSVATAEMALLMEWFTGEFDNYAQVYQEKEDSTPADLLHDHIHSIFHPVQIRALTDGQSFFVKQYMDGDERKVYRQRIYHFTPDPVERAVRLDIYAFVSAALDSTYAFAYQQPDQLTDLPLAQLRPTPGCEVYWTFRGDHFIGYMKERACNFVSQRSGKRIYITDSLRLTANELWISDQAEDEDGNYVFGHRANIPHRLRRCTYYTGWAAVPASERAAELTAIRGLRLHDQGQRIPLTLPDGSPTPYFVELAQLPYGADLEVLKLALYRTGEQRAIAYTWAEPHAYRLGLNMRTLQVGVTRAEQTPNE